MVLAAASATTAMLWFDGGGLGGSRGYPFAWYWWTDVSINDSPLSGYRWHGLVADIVFWLAAIIGLGLFIEWVIPRFSRRYETTNVA
jgi:hypothetical protein